MIPKMIKKKTPKYYMLTNGEYDHLNDSNVKLSGKQKLGDSQILT